MIDGISESEHIRINFMQVTIQCRLDPGKATGVREQIHFDIYFLDFRKNHSFRLFFVCIKKIVHYYLSWQQTAPIPRYKKDNGTLWVLTICFKEFGDAIWTMQICNKNKNYENMSCHMGRYGPTEGSQLTTPRPDEPQHEIRVAQLPVWVT